MSFERMKSDIAVAMAGRVAEEIIFGHDKVTSGAMSDIKMATSQEVETPKQIAHLMNKKENYDILENKINDVKSYILGKIS